VLLIANHGLINQHALLAQELLIALEQIGAELQQEIHYITIFTALLEVA
jgi:hypothetical protein